MGRALCIGYGLLSTTEDDSTTIDLNRRFDEPPLEVRYGVFEIYSLTGMIESMSNFPEVLPVHVKLLRFCCEPRGLLVPLQFAHKNTGYYHALSHTELFVMAVSTM